MRKFLSLFCLLIFFVQQFFLGFFQREREKVHFLSSMCAILKREISMRATGGEYHTHNRRRILFTLTEAMYCRKKVQTLLPFSLTSSKLIFPFSFFQRENEKAFTREQEKRVFKDKNYYPCESRQQHGIYFI